MALHSCMHPRGFQPQKHHHHLVFYLLQATMLALEDKTDRFALKSSFFSPSLHLLITSYKHQQQPLAPAAPRFSMRAAAKQAYICRDCGYIYNDRKPLKSYLIITSALAFLDDNYKEGYGKYRVKLCFAVCGAPKRRFREYMPAVAKNDNDTDVRKARKTQIQRDEAFGRALPIAVVVGVVACLKILKVVNWR